VTLRPGSYDANPPLYRGVIRNDSFPWYVCIHNDHDTTREARACAADALAQIKAAPDNAPPPDGGGRWEPGVRRRPINPRL
jgi:hypothetical protein